MDLKLYYFNWIQTFTICKIFKKELQNIKKKITLSKDNLTFFTKFNVQ